MNCQLWTTFGSSDHLAFVCKCTELRYTKSCLQVKFSRSLRETDGGQSTGFLGPAHIFGVRLCTQVLFLKEFTPLLFVKYQPLRGFCSFLTVELRPIHSLFWKSHWFLTVLRLLHYWQDRGIGTSQFERILHLIKSLHWWFGRFLMVERGRRHRIGILRIILGSFQFLCCH